MVFNAWFLLIPVILTGFYILLWIIARFSLWYLAWYLSKHYKIKIKVQLGSHCLKKIHITLPNDGVIEIDLLWLSSSLFSSSCKSRIGLCISGTNANLSKSDLLFEKRKKVTDVDSATSSTPEDSSSLLKKLQLYSFQIYKLNLVLKDSSNDSPHYVHFSLKEFSIYFKSLDEDKHCHELCAYISRAVFQLSKGSHTHSIEHSLLHLGVTCNFAISLDKNLSVRNSNVNLKLCNPEVIVQQGFHPDNLEIFFSNESKSISKESSIDVINIEKISKKIPKEVLAKIESFDMKWIQRNYNRVLTFSLQTIEVEVSQSSGIFSSSLVVQNVAMASGQLPLASVVKSSVKLKFENHVLDVNASLSNCHLLYNQEELQFWKQCLPKPSSSKSKALKLNQASTTSKRLMTLLKDNKVQLQSDMNDVFLCVALPGCRTFTAGLMHSNLKLDLQSSVENLKSRFLGGEIEVSIEILLEMFWITLGDGRNVNTSVLKRHHQWNTPLCLGMVLLKARDLSSDFRVLCMVDALKVEISPAFLALAAQLYRFLCPENKSSFYSPGSSEKTTLKRNEICTIQFTLTGANVFVINEFEFGLMTRIDSFKLDSVPEKIFFVVEGLKLASVQQSGLVFLCLKSSEIRSSLAYLQTIRLTRKNSAKDIFIQFLDELKMEWTTFAHMCLVKCLQDVKNVLSLLNKPDNTQLEPMESKKSSSLNLTIQLQGDINFCFILSKTHKFAFVGSELNVSFQPDRNSFQSEHLFVEFDGNRVFSFLNWSISSVSEEEFHIVNRQDFEGLDLKKNKAWNIVIEEWKLTFPYQYNFAEAFSEETITIVKWLKKLHRKNNSEDYKPPLPPDLAIKIKLFIMEVGDDPFEVVLRDNYELLEDEFNESLKRKEMLDDKIEKLREKHLLLASGKVEELYSTLSKKNADIYLQRSKQLYGSNSMRTNLFTAQFENVKIYVVADTSYHNKEKVLNVIQSTDPDSPIPDEGLDFTTLWCRRVSGTFQGISCHLRDFPQALLEIREFHFWGSLVGAEQEASKRAIRESVVEIGEPWGDTKVDRSMTSLKFYHDLTWDMDYFCMAYGPCWEPILAQVGLSFENISRPSADPSPALPWWDKMRLIYHGRLTLSIHHFVMLMQASLDPFNTTEQMEVAWTNVLIDWTNAKITMKGDLDIYAHTASKYDDCRLLHVPNVKMSFKLDWLCLGNPDDHHSVMPCAPDKVPEYSINQVHDSFRAFRSQNLILSLSMETKPVSLESASDVPSLLLYSSTLRWIENIKSILASPSRPTRRGKLFLNLKPKKPQFGRHFKSIRLAFNLHKFCVCYWMSFAKQRGFEILGGRFSLSSEHNLTLKAIEDGLKHRPRAEWSTAYLTCDLVESEVWLYNSTRYQNAIPNGSAPDRSYFISMTRVSYGREATVPEASRNRNLIETEDPPTHRLVLHGLKGAWTKNNRDVVFSLFDSYTKANQVKRSLSTDALKGFKIDSHAQRNRSLTAASNTSLTGTTASPITRLQSGHVASMLQKLISEAEGNPMVYTEEIEGVSKEQQLHGVVACQTSDVVSKNWLIELVNSQVMLRGCETSGYIILSAARTEILQRVHSPVWKERSLISKRTWVGSVDCLQYYATVDGGIQNPSVDHIMWLSVENIEEKQSVIISDLPDLVGSGHSVGGVVSNTVGGAPDPGTAPLQLQRIVSRCGCQFFYASYGDNVDPDALEEVPLLPDENDPWDSQTAVDSFTLTHHDLTICTNSLQYAMILDIINNVLLFVEPKKKEAFERLQGMRFKLQLSTTEDYRGPILELQNQVRYLLQNIRRLERETYLVHRALLEAENREDLQNQMESLEAEVENSKDKLQNASDELNMLINCYREVQVSAFKTRQRASIQNQSIVSVRRTEICFKYAQWRLTDADGQLGIADFVLSNFFYSKLTKNDDSVEHLLELGYVKATNLLPNQVYKDVLRPTELQSNAPVDHHRALRIFCRERAPVGGISVKEHFEINILPITIGLTHNFFTAMMKFFFPGRYNEKMEGDGEDSGATSKLKKRTTLITQRMLSNQDDISKMKERAEKNQTFVYIKIPEVPICVSYKGGKEKNIEDLHEINLNLHTLEYHNRTWTWLDLLMEMKKDSQKALLQQAIKQRLQIKSNRTVTDDSNQPLEEDKARLLLGTKLLGISEKNSKKGIFKKSGKFP